jgi:hypothetical protein
MNLTGTQLRWLVLTSLLSSNLTSPSMAIDLRPAPRQAVDSGLPVPAQSSLETAAKKAQMQLSEQMMMELSKIAAKANQGRKPKPASNARSLFPAGGQEPVGATFGIPPSGIRISCEPGVPYSGIGPRDPVASAINNPFIICNEMQLYRMRENSGGHYKIIKDIDLSQPAYNHRMKSFSGTLDGGNRTISGFSTSSWIGVLSGKIANLRFDGLKLRFSDHQACEPNLDEFEISILCRSSSLIEVVKNGMVLNLEIRNATADQMLPRSQAIDYMGTLAGTLWHGIASNIQVGVRMDSGPKSHGFNTRTYRVAKVGGIVGQAIGSSSSLTRARLLPNSYVSSRTETNNMGGVIGYCNGISSLSELVASAKTKVERNFGDTYTPPPPFYPISQNHTGGVVGLHFNTPLSFSYGFGELIIKGIGAKSDFSVAGGIAGISLRSSPNNLGYRGSILMSASVSTMGTSLGGLIGGLSSSILEDSYFAGYLFAGVPAKVGGLAGNNYASSSDSWPGNFRTSYALPDRLFGPVSSTGVLLGDGAIFQSIFEHFNYWTKSTAPGTPQRFYGAGDSQQTPPILLQRNQLQSLQNFPGWLPFLWTIHPVMRVPVHSGEPPET